jgi:hypothetical protein
LLGANDRFSHGKTSNEGFVVKLSYTASVA